MGTMVHFVVDTEGRGLKNQFKDQTELSRSTNVPSPESKTMK